MALKKRGGVCLFGTLFRDLLRASIFGCILVDFGIVWAIIWPHFGAIWRNFAHPLIFKGILMEVNPKKAPISRCGMLPFWHLFRDLFQRSICLCISVTLLLPLGYLLAPFWFVFVSFWLPFGTVWLTFAHLRVLFSHFGTSQRNFQILLYFQRKSYRSQRVLCKLFIARWRKRGFAALKIK